MARLGNSSSPLDLSGAGRLPLALVESAAVAPPNPAPRKHWLEACRLPFALGGLRLTVGFILVAVGIPEYHSAEWIGRFHNYAAPVAAAHLAAGVEILTGVALILGVGTRIAAIWMCVEWLYAAKHFYMPRGPITAVDVYAYPLVMAAAAFALACLGAGDWSLDHLVSRVWHRRRQAASAR